MNKSSLLIRILRLFLPMSLALTWIDSSAVAQSVTIPNVAATGPALAAQVQGNYAAPPTGLTSQGVTTAPVTGNGDMSIMVGGAASALNFYVGKADFWGVERGAIMPVGSLVLSNSALSGASYSLHQNVGAATITGQFTQGASQLTLTSWLSVSQNSAVIQLNNTGSLPLTFASTLLDGFSTVGNQGTYGSGTNSTWLAVSPDTANIEIGNHVYVQSAAAFIGSIADLQIFNSALAPAQLNALETDSAAAPLLQWTALSPGVAENVGSGVSLNPGDLHGGSATFTGNSSSEVWVGAMCLPQTAFTMVAWAKPTSTGTENCIAAAQIPVSAANGAGQYPYVHGLKLVLESGTLSATLNYTTITAASAIPLNQWTQAAVTYDGTTMTLYANGTTVASTTNFPTASYVMGWDKTAIHLGVSGVPNNDCAPQGVLIQGIVGATATLGSQGTLNFTVPAGGQVSIVLAAVTNLNNSTYLATAQLQAQEATSASLAALLTEHNQWWSNFWSKSFVQISDQAIQSNWYASLYLLACCSTSTSPPPGLWGNFVTNRQPSWQGDYTLDYNYEAPFWAAYASNHMELAANYEAPLIGQISRGDAIGAENGYQGIYFYTHLIPPGGWSDDYGTFWGQKSDALFAAVDCVQRWRYTQDPVYAAEVFPYLKGVADFWDNYLVLQGGVYVDLDDSVAERTGNDTNPATTLAFLRLLYPALIQMSQVLNQDASMQPTWSGILAQLSSLPVVAASSISSLNALGAPYNAAGVNVIRDSSAGTAFPTPEVTNYQNHAVTSTSPGMNSTQTIFPGWQYGIESSGTSLQAAYNTVWLAAEWYDFNDCCTFYPAAALAGFPPSQILSNLDTLLTYYAYPNFMISMGGGGTENYAVTPATLAAMFMQSHQTNIHVFPNWPATQSASFGNLSACGGFLVSAAITLGTANYVQVTSNEGQMLNLANPWASSLINVTSSIQSPATLSGAVLNYQTQTGEVVTFTPASQPSLSTPTGLTGTFSSTGGISLNLAWNPVSGASSYNVKRASVSGGPYATLATVTSGTSYTDVNVAAQTTYYYTVSAIAPGVESANSTELPLTTVAPGVAAPGLVASYLFDEGAGTMSADATGDGFTATLYGTAWTTGVERDALLYNGTSSFATIPALNLNTDTMTITTWVKLSGSQSTSAGLVYCRAGTTICGLQLGTADELRYTWNGATESNTYNWNSGLVPPNGQWTFAAVVVTASNAIIYMQPQGGAMQSATNTVANTPAAFDGVTNFGQDPLGGRFFKGSMDDVRIYNVALSASAVGVLAAGVNDVAPTVATPAAASPNPAGGPNCNLSVLGASANGESTLTYTWAATSVPAGASAPAFSPNGTNSAQNAIAIFSAPGAYTLEANITDAYGYNVTSSVNVTVTTAQLVWTGGGGNGNWSNAANWSEGAAQAGEQLVLSGSSTDNLSSGTAFTSINLQGGNTSLSGNQITLSQGANAAIASTGAKNSIGQAILLGSNITIAVTSGSLTLAGPINNNGYQLILAAAAGSTVSIQGIVSGAGGLTASGSGTEILSGTNTYYGTTTISEGTLQLGDGVTRNGVVAGNITDNATLLFANPFAQTYAGVVSGTGLLVKSGSGTLTLTAAQTYTGSTTVSGGTLELANIPIPALPAAGSTLWLDSTKGLALSGANVLSWADQSGDGNSATGVSGYYAAYTASGPSGQPALYFDGSAYLTDPLSASNDNETIFAVVQPSVLANASYTILGSSASGGLQLRFNGDQLQFVEEYIANISTSTGTVDAYAPSVVIGTTTPGSQSYYVNSTPIGTGTGTYTFGSGLTSIIGKNGKDQSENLNGYLSALIVYPSVLTTAQIAQTEMYLYAEFIPNSAGFNYGALPGGSALNLSESGAALDLDGVSFSTQLLTGVAGTNIYLGGASLNIESSNGSSLYAGNIADTGGAGSGTGGSLFKNGTGTLTLSGILTYSGTTQVNAGTLCIAGQLMTGGPVNVAGGATLNLSGGIVNCRTLQVLTGGTLTGAGTVNATVVNNGAVTATGDGQNLSFSGSVVNYGTFILTGGASLQASGSFVNNGLLDVMTGAQKLPANLENNGVVLTASVVKVSSLSLASGTFTLNIQSYTGHTYQLQKSTNLSTWQNVGAAQAGATGSALVMSDTNAAAAGTFYRIAVGP